MARNRFYKMAMALLVSCLTTPVHARNNPLGVGDTLPGSRDVPEKKHGPVVAGYFGTNASALLVAKTQQVVTTINGKIPPGIVTTAEITLLLSAPLSGGQVLYQYRTVRQPGTRAPIHTHPYGGSTCILKGESTLRVEGIPGARTYKAGQCFFMPSGPAMANFNSGKIPFTAIDTFVLRPGEKPMKVVEAGAAHIYEDHL
jgi:quercetin dioxygenase-like cupin family protein